MLDIVTLWDLKTYNKNKTPFCTALLIIKLVCNNYFLIMYMVVITEMTFTIVMH